MFHGDKRALENVCNNSMCTLIKEGIVNFTDKEGLAVYVSNITEQGEEKYWINKGELVRYKILAPNREFVLARYLNEIISQSPTSVEDLKFFAHFQSVLGMFGGEMKDLLSGMFCHNHVRPELSLEEQVKLSNQTLNFVKSWNDFILYRYCDESGLRKDQAMKI